MASSRDEIKSAETPFIATDNELINALQTLIDEHCPKCLREESPIETNADKIIIHSTHSDLKAKIRDEYIINVLQIPLTDDEKQRKKLFFHINKQAALANPIIQKVISNKRKKIKPYKDKIKVAAFLNIFFDMPDGHAWKIRNGELLVEGPSESYASHDPNPGRYVPDIRALLINDAVEISPQGKALGFNSDIVTQLRSHIVVEDHRHGCYYKLKEDDAILPIKKLIAEIEATTQELDIANVIVSTIDSPTTLDVSITTARLRNLIKEYTEHYAPKVKKLLLESTPLNPELRIISEYLFFTPETASEAKPANVNEDSISKNNQNKV